MTARTKHRRRTSRRLTALADVLAQPVTHNRVTYVGRVA